jgi:predicted AlkP superfamily phosphohydrolase/phosphomutase
LRRFLVFFTAGVLLLSGLWYANTHLVPALPPDHTPTPLSTRTPEPTPTPVVQSGPRAVIISLAGARADRAQAYMADGTMPALAQLGAQGTLAQYALSVNPPLTATGHASLATGAYPATTGIVSDRYHRPGDELHRHLDAMQEPEFGAEPVWRTAMREARRTAAVCWPGTSLNAPETLADYTVTYGTTDAPSAQHIVALEAARTWPGAPRSFSTPREGTLTIAKDETPLVRLYLLAIDTADDGQAEYDTFYLSRERQVDDRSALLRLGEAVPLVIDDHLLSGAHFILSEASADAATIYQSRVCYNRAQPNELVREVNKRFGFFPAGADDSALKQGWITPEQYVRAVETQSRWISAVSRFVLETYRPEVLFTSQPPVDALQRQFLLLDPAQPGHSPELAAEYDRYVRQGYALADAAVQDLADALDPEQTALFVVSDRGMAPVHSEVYLNTLLAAYGLLAYEEGTGGTEVRATGSKAIAIASGGAAHIYINLRGRERAGIVAEADYPAVQDAIIAALVNLKDEAEQPIFGQVLRRDELLALGLSARTAGDVYVQAAPGYSLNDRWGSPAILAPAAHYGQPGYAADLPDMHAIFVAAGRGVQRGAQVGPVHIVDLAPTIDHLLGLQPPEPRAGRVLEEVLLP